MVIGNIGISIKAGFVFKFDRDIDAVILDLVGARKISFLLAHESKDLRKPVFFEVVDAVRGQIMLHIDD